MLLGTLSEYKQKITEILKNQGKTDLVPFSKGIGVESIELQARQINSWKKAEKKQLTSIWGKVRVGKQQSV